MLVSRVEYKGRMVDRLDLPHLRREDAIYEELARKGRLERVVVRRDANKAMAEFLEDQLNENKKQEENQQQENS